MFAPNFHYIGYVVVPLKKPRFSNYDYRALNEQIAIDAYPLPTIGKNQLWYIVDLKDAFNKIILAKSIPSYNQHPRCMLEGLKNSPAIWYIW